MFYKLKLALFGFKVGDILTKVRPDWLEDWEPYTSLSVEILNVGKRSYRVRMPRDVDHSLLIQADALASSKQYDDHFIYTNLSKDSAHKTFRKTGVNSQIIISEEVNKFIK